MPLFSIILTCYNAERYLVKCIDSILGQTYRDFELLCVNDGSTDETQQILNHYQQRDERITIIEQSNMGLSGARNAGMAQSSGRYLTFIDPDDWYNNDYLQKVAESIDDEDIIQCGFVKAHTDGSQTIRLFDEKQPVAADGMLKLRRRYIGLTGDELSSPSTGDLYNSVCTKFIKRSIVRQHNLLFDDTRDIGPSEDLLFTCRYVMYCQSALCLPVEGYNYMDNPSSSTRTYQPQLLEQWYKLYDRLWEIVKDQPLYAEAFANRRRLSIIGLALNQIRCSKNFSQQRQKVVEILNDPLYKGIYQDFDLSVMPLKWKLFFHCVKAKRYTHLTLLLRRIGR